MKTSQGRRGRSCEAKRFLWAFRKTKSGQILLFGQQLQLTIKLIDTKNRQSTKKKNCLTFFSRKNIMNCETVRYKCNLMTNFYFLSLISFQNMNT